MSTANAKVRPAHHVQVRTSRAAHPGYCPGCGERVSPFAAGCALCGADLDPRRWQSPPSVTQRLSCRLPSGWRARALKGGHQAVTPLITQRRHRSRDGS
jgi:hypothetical protein